jgi:iron(III) transport system permease protein
VVVADRLGVDPAVIRPSAAVPPGPMRADSAPCWRQIITLPRLLAAGVGLVLAVLTLLPLTVLLVGSFRPDGLPSTPGWTVEHYVEVWGSAYNWRLVVNTLIFAGCSTFLAIVLATALSWLLERTDLPARNLFRAMILMPMATPPLLLAIGWALVLAPRIGIVSVAMEPLIGPIDQWFNIYSLPGVIFVQMLAYVPTSVLMLSPAIRALDPALEEAALMAGANRWQVLWRIGLPILRPALLSVMTILVIVGMLAFDVPAVIGIPGHVDLMSIEIFRLMTPPSGFPDYGAAAATNTMLFVVLIGGLILYRRTIRQAARFATITGKGYKPAQVKLGRWRAVAVGLVGFYFLLAVLLPFIALLWASVIPYFAGFSLAMLQRASFAAYVDLLGSPRLREAGINAVLVSVTAAGSLLLLALATSWIVLRSKLRQAWTLDVLSMIPLGVPPLMMGVAMVFMAFSVRFLPLYGTIWLIAIGHIIHFMPVASRMMQSGMLQISRELEDAAATAGASLVQTFRRIMLPLLGPTIMAMIIWILVHSVREFSIAVMLQSGRNSVLSTILFSYWQTGSPERAAALAVLLMLLLLALVGFLSVLSHRNVEI